MSASDPLDLAAALAVIDQVNAADPTGIEWQGATVPRALLQGRRASDWLTRLRPDASDALQLAARGHHVRRWELARSAYAEGRSGYLLWRRDVKKLHASALAEILVPFGATPELVARVGALVQRVGLGTDPDAQAVEDVACLVFMETDEAALRSRLEEDTMSTAVAKTLAKMSPEARALVPEAQSVRGTAS